MRIAIQGERGSFHDEVARSWFGDGYEMVASDTFAGVFAAVEQARADAVVVAIENTLAGSINPVYDLIEKHRYPIIGEVLLAIHQQLIVKPGDEAEITHIYSHPVALAQCADFLDAQYPNAERIEYHDTAAAVEHIASLPAGAAAIAGRRAASLHGMQILKEDIEDNPHNHTRFLVLQPGASAPLDANRSSLVLTTDHTPGALVRVLSAIANRGINMAKLQSRPIIGSPWRYKFYIVLDTAGAELGELVAEIEPLTASLRVLGEYRHIEPLRRSSSVRMAALN